MLGSSRPGLGQGCFGLSNWLGLGKFGLMGYWAEQLGLNVLRFLGPLQAIRRGVGFVGLEN